jgi:ABC-2 type transport system permease protein
LNKREKAFNNVTGELFPALGVEFQKVKRSKTLWLTAAVFLLITLIGGLFMFILKDPELAKSLGLVGAKAQLFGGTADWPGFFNLMILLVSVGGLIIFGFIYIWIFGREFVDRTVYDFLSLPTSRLSIVFAKVIAAAAWSIALILFVFVLILGIGAALQLPEWSEATCINGLVSILVTAFLTILTCITFGLVASITRGYLPAAGGIFLVLLLGQVFSRLGYGQFFPWTVPMLYSGAAEALTGGAPAPLGLISYLLVGLTGILSYIVTATWWRNADQT